MRMFFKMNNDDEKYVELDIKKIKPEPGDRIIVTTEDSLDYIRGRLILDNISNIDVQLLEPGTHTITKTVSSLVLFEKIPKAVIATTLTDAVSLKITL